MSRILLSKYVTDSMLQELVPELYPLSSCTSWLDRQAPNSVLYVSFGSLDSIDEKALAEMAWGLANSDQPFLWVIRPGSVHGSKWIELLPENLRERIGERGGIVKWAPQEEVLAHEAVGEFWSHCGWNSTLERMCEGVPMICWPCFGDQNVNARYLSYVWGVGLEVEHELNRGDVERAVRRLMVDEEGKEIRRRAIEFKEKAELSIGKVPRRQWQHFKHLGRPAPTTASPLWIKDGHLGAVLQSKGFSITVALTQFNSSNLSDHPDFTFVSIPDGLSDHGTSSLDFIAFITALNNNLEVPLREHLTRMIKQEEQNERIACIIYDTIMYKAEAVAHCLKLPSIILQTSSVSTSLTFDAFPPTSSTRLYSPPRLNSTRPGAWASSIQVPFFSVGPLHKIGSSSSSSLLKEDTDCLTWLDKQSPNSVIYEVAEERGCIVEWAPQKEVLGHEAVGGSWSHCGWNSTVESISAGVPMMCRPCFGDQRVNARIASHVWGVGIEMDNGLERGQVERAVRRLMVGKEGEEMRQRANDLKMKLELSILEDGSSYNALNNLVEYVSSFLIC
ncbi:hypothetical protein Acr_00g0061710 [Actinidia rufa]|uniref:Uncharacterized protein n=1 Tax=Actinidia rufa TaxID=165716 RepID=A0A7J0DNQ7_9ERIC|nr:hypothetical protein Acr_00g0061710 [Actinidia rufa]